MTEARFPGVPGPFSRRPHPTTANRPNHCARSSLEQRPEKSESPSAHVLASHVLSCPPPPKGKKLQTVETVKRGRGSRNEDRHYGPHPLHDPRHDPQFHALQAMDRRSVFFAFSRPPLCCAPTFSPHPLCTILGAIPLKRAQELFPASTDPYSPTSTFIAEIKFWVQRSGSK